MKKTVGPSETRIMMHVLAQLQDKFPDGLWERRNVIAVDTGHGFVRANKKGTADISGCYRGRYVELEIKVPGGIQSKAQRSRQEQVELAGGVYSVVTCWAMAKEVVEGIR